MSVETVQPVMINEQGQHIQQEPEIQEDPAQPDTQQDAQPDNHHDEHYHRKRRALKRVASKIFGHKHKAHEESHTDTTNTADSQPSSSSSSSSSASSSSRSRNNSPRSSRRGGGSARRASIQGRKSLMSAALPASGPERRRAAQALLTELEKYDHLQRRSMLRNLPPLQFHVTIEKRVNGRPQEAEVEISMNELREQLLEILRSEGVAAPAVRPPQRLRQIKSGTLSGVKDSSVFPTHIHDGRPLPDEKAACTICLDEYVEGDEIKSLPCFHFYHSECVDEWLKRSRMCPNCNVDVENEDAH